VHFTSLITVPCIVQFHVDQRCI